ncbi:ROK family transcriptional regulator [Piscibacillus halophilus]|uniref:ROK family transcriptional regulator n=1 Tax=Piscibacillus halophilus TaxID=571933 RepID=UPI00158DB82F|nr:ROK family transcriptional regulator [Piscibacillus halophilus]
MIINVRPYIQEYSSKFFNKKRILHYIQNNPGISRADISKALNISKPTVSSLVDELILEKWVLEKAGSKASSAGGRKPIQIFFNKDAYHIVGVDIGGTVVEMAIMDLEGKVSSKSFFKTQDHVGDFFVEKLATEIIKLIQDSGKDTEQFLGVGIGVPGMTDIENGVVIDAPTIKWTNFPLVSSLEPLLPFPVYIDNDVNVAALGEHWKGEGRYEDNFVMITLGTGIGSGIIINNQLYRGHSFAAGEVGYMITDKSLAEEKYEEAFKGFGFLDNHVGGSSFTTRMIQTNYQDMTAKEIFIKAQQKDAIAMTIIDDVMSHLAIALVNVISVINPKKIVLGGGISKSIGPYLSTLEEKVRRHIPMDFELAVTKLQDVSLIGAGRLFLKENDSILKF